MTVAGLPLSHPYCHRRVLRRTVDLRAWRVKSTTFHSPQSQPTASASSDRERTPSSSASRPNTSETLLLGVASSSSRNENTRESARSAGSATFVTTSVSSYSVGGNVGSETLPSYHLLNPCLMTEFLHIAICCQLPCPQLFFSLLPSICRNAICACKMYT